LPFLRSLISRSSSAPTVGFQFPHYQCSLKVHADLSSAVSLCNWTGVVETHICEPPMDGVTAFKLTSTQPPFSFFSHFVGLSLVDLSRYGAAPSRAGNPSVAKAASFKGTTRPIVGLPIQIFCGADPEKPENLCYNERSHKGWGWVSDLDPPLLVGYLT